MIQGTSIIQHAMMGTSILRCAMVLKGYIYTITIILTRVDLIKTSLSSIVCALLLRLKSYSFVVIIFSIN